MVPRVEHPHCEPFRVSEDGTRAIISILISQAGHDRRKMVVDSPTDRHRLHEENMEAPDHVVGLVVLFPSLPVSHIPDTPSVGSGHSGFIDSQPRRHSSR
jgi:hypothetical protein